MKCYLCGSDGPRVIRNRVRHDIRRDVLECPDCGLNFLRPEEKNLKEYYSGEYRNQYSCVIGETPDCRTQFEMLLPLQRIRIAPLSDFLRRDMKVLDVGCSTGHFLSAVQNYVGECIGIELNEREAAFTQQELGIKTYRSSISETDLPKNYFDVITMYQVLEHVSNPIQFLKAHRPYLKPEGLIVVEVPNLHDVLLDGFENEAFRNFWFREPHLFNFSAKTLSSLLGKSGFEGTVSGCQWYGFLNHVHWIQKSEPQKDIGSATATPTLIERGSLANEAKTTLNNWFRKVDAEYRSLLERFLLSDSLLFIGRMK